MSEEIPEKVSRKGQKGGQTLVKKRGRDYMRKLGRLGYLAALLRHPDFHQKGGRASWRKQNLCQLENGYYPNQSPALWGYCAVAGCHYPHLTGNIYCIAHT